MISEQTEQTILKYLSKDTDEYERFQSLTTIFEKIAKPNQSSAEFYDDDDEIESKLALQAALNEMVQDGLLESHWGERDYEASYRLTDEGTYQASGFKDYIAEPPPNVLLTESGEPLITEGGQFIELEDPIQDARPKADHLQAVNASTSPPEISSPTLGITSSGGGRGHGQGQYGAGSYGDKEQAINSDAWTGLTRKTIIDARNAKLVSQLIEKALTALPESAAGNFEHMQAAAYLKAAKELVDAPEPPSELIWQLISKAADLVGLIGLFYAIFAQIAP